MEQELMNMKILKHLALVGAFTNPQRKAPAFRHGDISCVHRNKFGTKFPLKS